MLQIHTMTFNPFHENTYLLYDDTKACIIVDPGNLSTAENQQLSDTIENLQLQPKAIYLTHSHLDHVFGIQYVVDKYHTPIALHPLEWARYQQAPAIAEMYGMPPFPIPEPTDEIDIKNPLLVGEEQLEIFFTPGHSPGEVCFYHASSNQLIAGDVLFRESIGRTDLPGGDHELLLQSIRKELWPLPDETTVYTGHGPTTTIGHEKQHNPFLQ